MCSTFPSTQRQFTDNTKTSVWWPVIYQESLHKAKPFRRRNCRPLQFILQSGYISVINKKIDPLCYNAVNCVHFLTSLFSAGKSYSAINTARSALSTFLTNEAGLTIGSAPLVKRFMKGVLQLRPPLPRYRFVWDISVVLSFV